MSANPPPVSAVIAHRYELRGELARGGMGVVLRVVDRATGEERALKRMQVKDPKHAALQLMAFEREYQVLASIDHPRIIRVFDYGIDEDGPYYTMELLQGQDLKSGVPRPWREVCSLMRDVATSLSLLHVRKLLHRDVSAGNVKIDSEGRCKLLDFGALAQFGVHDMIIGTAPMVAPEVLLGQVLDQRTDLYALGALAYWSLTGQHAYPARAIIELEQLWDTPPSPPSHWQPSIPPALDALVLRLMSPNALARPGNAAVVIARLTVIAELAPESGRERQRLAQSLLLVPPFVGRVAVLDTLRGKIERAIDGRGAAVRIEGHAGAGRSRLLQEMGIRAQLSGATVVSADASGSRQQFGTLRQLALRLLEALPLASREAAQRHAGALSALGDDVLTRAGVAVSRPPAASPRELTGGGELANWFLEVSRRSRLLIQVDNVEYCDDASLGSLLLLSRAAPAHRVILVISERSASERPVARGLALLREHSELVALPSFSRAETLELMCSLFGATPNVERFADWLHTKTAGSPLHCVEITRQLVAQSVILYEEGIWVLPVGRPHAELPDTLEDVISARLRRLGADALDLARNLCLQRLEPSLELCRALLANAPSACETRNAEQRALLCLDELAQQDVVVRDQDAYRFSSAAVRDALLKGMDERATAQSHQRLGNALSALGSNGNQLRRIEAGWHLLKGGAELQGADLIANVMLGGIELHRFSANSYPLGLVCEAALKVYKRARRSQYERLPLLTALAQAGFYDDPMWIQRYGDDALDALEDLSGFRLANRLRGWAGSWLALIVALPYAWLRYRFAPRSERPYSFLWLLNQLFITVTTMVGAMALTLDSERAERTTEILRPSEALPRFASPRAAYEFCKGLSQIGRDNQAKAFATFQWLAARLELPGSYRLMSDDARNFLRLGVHFARGAFGVFRADSGCALESATHLERSSLKMYEMIASQLRYLYHTNRGELALAAKHREQVDVHAAYVGSAWQVELWEPAAILPVHYLAGDVVEVTRIAHRFPELISRAPSLKLYGQLADLAVRGVRGEPVPESDSSYGELDEHPPRSFIGWSLLIAMRAATLNDAGRHAEAKRLLETALNLMNDEDRQYVILYLQVDLQRARADAGLGLEIEAFARLDSLLERFSGVDHPLAMGLLYEMRARISFDFNRLSEYRDATSHAQRLLRATENPGLITRVEQLVELERNASTMPFHDISLLDGETTQLIPYNDSRPGSAPKMNRTTNRSR